MLIKHSLFFMVTSLLLLFVIAVVTASISADRPPIDYLLLNDTKTMTSAQLQRALDDFHSWFEGHYGEKLLVKIKPSEDMRLGVEALARFREGQPYLSVPLRLCIDANTLSTGAEAPPIFKEFWPFLKSRRDLPSGSHAVQLLLASFLVYARWVVPKQTFWSAYVELLPRRMETPEHSFTDNDIDFLEGFPRFQEKIRQARKKREIEFYWMRDHVTKNAKFEEILPKKFFTRPRWSWAMAILNTRMIWWEGSPHLVPMLDMVNCDVAPGNSKRANVHETVREGDRAVTRAGYNIQKGEEIFENYGQHNGYYFLNHGFFLAENPHDCYYITLPRPERELTRKALFLTGAKIEDGDQLCTSLATQRTTDVLFDVARIYTLPDKVLEKAIATRVLPTRDTDKQTRRTIRWIGKRLREKQNEIEKTQNKYSSREQDPEDAPHAGLIQGYVETMGMPIDDALRELRRRVKTLTERIKTREARLAREELEAKKKAADESAQKIDGSFDSTDEGDEGDINPNSNNIDENVKKLNRGLGENGEIDPFDDADGDRQMLYLQQQRASVKKSSGAKTNFLYKRSSSSKASPPNKIDDDF